jgi:hypothetical protein
VAKVKVDTTGVETDQGVVKPGLYTVKIKEARIGEAKSSGEAQLAVIYEIQGGDFDKRVLFDYINLENDTMKFRLAAFQDALGIPRKGTLDTDEIEGKKVKVRTIVQKSEEYGDQARIRNVMSAKTGSSSEEDLDDDADDGEDEEEVDYEEMDLDELKEELEAREIEPEGKLTKKKAIKLLEEDDEAEEDESDDDDDDDDEAEADSDDESEDEDEDDDEEDDDDEDDEEADYSEMDLGELKEAAKEKKIKTKGLKKKDLIKALEAADEEEEQDYDEMDLKELKDECKERGLKTTGKKADLVKRLEKDDKTGPDGEPF